ncbi:hypothetical protein FB451DRAFT_1208160 [Mycena latifolia]|nr:hypothetical protein FB451DRAFT_1208160 [Mycena latifolia]
MGFPTTSLPADSSSTNNHPPLRRARPTVHTQPLHCSGPDNHLHTADISSHSINPIVQGQTNLPDSEDEWDDQTLIFLNDYPDQSIVNQRPVRVNVPLSYVSPEVSHPTAVDPQRSTEDVPTAPELLQRPANGPAPRSPQGQPPSNTAPIPGFFRPDPATDRAAARAHDCRELARSVLVRLELCEPLLQVSRSADSCRALDGIFASLSDVLHPSHCRHACTLPGICAHESWHARHNAKLEDLAQRLEHFLADFGNPPPVPRSTSELTAKLARHVNDFQLLQACLERSWIRLDYAAAEDALRDCSDAIRIAERDLAMLRRDHVMLRRRKEAVRGRFEATSGHHPR